MPSNFNRTTEESSLYHDIEKLSTEAIVSNINTEDKKVINKSENIQNNPENIQKKSEFYYCDYCNKQFTLYTNKRRHELHRCKKIYNITR